MFKAYFESAGYIAAIVAFLLFVLTCHRGNRFQAIWAAVLLVCASKFTVLKAFGLDMFIPELPVAVSLLYSWLNVGLFILAALALVGFWIPPRYKVWLLPVLAWGLAAWGIWQGVKPPAVRDVEVAVPNLPAALEGYKIAHLADPHVSALLRAERTRKIVSAINAAKPDLIVCTGDIVDGSIPRRMGDVLPLTDLAAPDGVWYVSGNHEFYSAPNEWRKWFRVNGFHFLHAQSVRLRDGLYLAGVDAREVVQFAAATTNAAVALAQVPRQGAFTIFLDHRPGNARQNAALGVNLQLSGHTHGGVFPLFDRYVQRLNKGFVRGLYDLGEGKRLFVSAGAGQWAGAPVRWGVGSEIPILTLRRCR